MPRHAPAALARKQIVENVISMRFNFAT